jgi:hypothetical protein
VKAINLAAGRHFDFRGKIFREGVSIYIGKCLWSGAWNWKGGQDDCGGEVASHLNAGDEVICFECN